MNRKYKPVLRVLALIMVIVCLGVSLAPASFAFAGVLDPAAWLYPIWSMYGAQNGVNVTTTGDADFTIDGMTSLWNEYQASRVSSGLQQVAQTITDFVNGVKGFVSVIAGAVTGGSLNTKLMLGAGIVGALDAFWNWIITDKLGGTSIDSTDFDQTSGNLAFASNDSYVVLPHLETGSQSGAYVGDYGNTQLYVSTPDNVDMIVILYYAGGNGSVVAAVCSVQSCSFDEYQWVSWYGSNSRRELNIYDSATGLYWIGGGLPVSPNKENFTVAGSEREMLTLAYQYFHGELPSAGDLTVAPDAGVDVLGFPDSDEVNYVPSDAVIPWNIPYDSTKDTDAYIDAAFADAVSGDLTIGEEGEVIQPVPGVGPVGDYVAVGLGDVFPFCIPFDIYDFLSALAADPVAPSFTAELAFPEAVGGSQYVELDFDTPTFNQLASILRTMELLAFIVGLALLTRSMFIRG